jgi:N-methylhydantoinase A
LMRYVGQGYEVEVPLEMKTINEEDHADIATRFNIVYRDLFGRAETMPLEIISWRVVVSGPVPEFSLQQADAQTDSGDAKKGQRLVCFDSESGFTETIVYDRALLESGFTASGPAIVEERESTLVVPPDFTLSLHTSGNLILDRRT